MILATPAAAGATEICDAIFNGLVFSAGGPPLAPGANNAMVAPELVIGYLARCISRFYTDIIRKYLSMHMAGLDPPQANPVSVDSVRNFEIRKIVRNMLITRNNLNLLTRLCERCAPGDFDSFINRVGIHIVLNVWSMLLMTAPEKIDKLLNGWIEKWMCMST